MPKDRSSTRRYLGMGAVAVLIATVFSPVAPWTSVLTAHATTTTWYVATTGSDSNPGTSGQPFRTINKGAASAQPGDTVLISSGVYRETVAPPRGGDSEATRITYSPAAGANVTVKGSEELAGWSLVSGSTYTASMSGLPFGSYNPYTIPLRYKSNQTLGEVFWNGARLAEVASTAAVLTTPMSWKANSGGTTMNINLNGANPSSGTVEVTVREQIFSPSTYGLGFITIDGIKFYHAANQAPANFWVPADGVQKGAVSTAGGHDWIIKNSTVRFAKGIGIDFGYQGGRPFKDAGFDAYLENGSNVFDLAGRIGFNLIQGNTVGNNGVSGIAGMWSPYSQVIGNVVENNNYLNYTGADPLHEEAAIKVHFFVGGVIKDNLVRNNTNVLAIWLDNQYEGARVTGNVLVDNTGPANIYLEMGTGPAYVDNNVIIGTGVQAGVYNATSGGAVISHNLFAGVATTIGTCDCRQSYVYPPDMLPSAIGGTSQPSHVAYNQYFNNMFIGTGLSVPAENATRYENDSDWNVFLGGAHAASGYDSHSVEVGGSVSLSHSSGATTTLTMTVAPATWAVPTHRIDNSAIGADRFTGWKMDPVNRDYFGEPVAATPLPGPFATLATGTQSIQLWPKTSVPIDATRTARTTVNDNLGVDYFGDWTYQNNRSSVAGARAWAGGEYMNDVHMTTAQGSSAAYSFTGTGVGIVMTRSNACGNFDVFIDGTFRQTVNCYSATTITQAEVWSTQGLSAGHHRIEIVNSSASMLTIDAFRISNIVNDTAGAVTYSGIWTHQGSRGLGEYGDDVTYTTTNGAYFTYKFWGTGIELIGTRAVNLGEIDIYMDGVFQQTVNAHSPATVAQQTVFSRTNMTFGEHTIKAVKKSGTYMSVDALNVLVPEPFCHQCWLAD